MKKLFLVQLVILLLVALIFSGCAKPSAAPAPAPAPTPTPSPAPVKPIVMKFASTSSPTAWAIKDIYEPWAKELGERTQGRVEVKIYPASVLGKGIEMYDMVREGAVDIISITLKEARGKFYLPDVYNFPFLLEYDAVDKNGIPIDYMLWDKYFIPLELTEVKVLWGTRTENNVIHLREKPVKTVDLKGMLIGMAPGKMLPAIFKAVGAAPEAILPPDTYTALDRGLVDGVLYPAEVMLNMKLYEVMKHMFVVGIGGGPLGTLMSPKTWASLPPDIQKIIDELSIVWRAKHLNGWGVNSKKAMKIAEEKGIEISYLSPEDRVRWVKATEGIGEEWMAEVDAVGLPATELVNEIKQLLSEK